MKHIRHFALLIWCCLVLAFAANAQCDFTLSANASPVACFGGSTGSIDLTVGNSVGPFTFLWSNLSTTDDLNGLVAGTYTVTVTDALNCTATLSSVVTQPANFIIDVSDGLLTCSNIQTSVTVNVISGGTPPFTWLLSNGGIGTNNSTTFFAAPIFVSGTYFVTVTDANGCTASDQGTVGQDIVLPVAVGGPDQTITCFSPIVSLDGTASTTGAQFGAFWTTPDGQIISGNNSYSPVVAAPGTYTLTVLNFQNGCSATDQVIVTQDVAEPTFSYTQQLGIPCGGGNVTLTGTGGVNNTYSWTGPNNFSSTQQNPVTNAPGIYTLVVTSLNGCTSSGQVTVFPGPAIPSQNFSITNLPCTPGVFGAIDMTVNFGTGPYTYLWSNGVSAEDVADLFAGTYSVSVEDATGCTYYAEVPVSQTITNITLNAVATPPTCFGAQNGSINLSADNGLMPYTYTWIGPAGYSSTVEDPAGLRVGNYSVTVTDASGCTRTTVVNVSSPAAMSVPFNGVTITNLSCPGAADGAINISPTGGTLPYTYDWGNDGPENPDNDAQDLVGIPAGIYTITITDANGCTLIPSSFNVAEPAALQISAVVTPTPCGSAGSEGAIDLSVSGGLPASAYLWTNGVTTPDINQLAAGDYTVTVTQSNGCTQTFTANVFQGGIIPTDDFTITPASCTPGATDGAIALNNLPAAAQAPLTFEWVGPVGFSGTTQNIVGLPAGNYNLTVTDANFCQFIASVIVSKIPGSVNISQGNTLLNCTNAALDLIVSGGTAPYSFQWSDGSTVENLIYTSTGTYTVTVTDASGCSNTASFQLTGVLAFGIATNVINETCIGGGGGSINVSISNGTGSYDFIWSNGVNTLNQSNLPPGTYCVTVTDLGNGCSDVRCAVVQPDSQPSISMSNNQPPTCWGWSDGTSVVNLTNPGAGPYSWALAGPASQTGTSPTEPFTITSLSDGTYCLTVTNSIGCTATSCFVVIAPAPIGATLEELSNNCNAAVIRANVTGGVPPLAYSWESSAMTITATTPVITAPQSGLYQLFVTDASGCGEFELITITLANGGNCGYIQGDVVRDINENCIANFNEPKLSGWLVQAVGDDTLYGITDANGHYVLGVPFGTYVMKALPPNNLWTACAGTLPVTVDMANDSVFGGNLPVKSFLECPALSVSIGTNQLRRCFSNNYYHVNYCNEGTAMAINAYVDVKLDPFTTFISSNIAAQQLGTNNYRFWVGNLDIGECGTFYIRVAVSCSAVLGQTHCTEAHIFPDSLCNTNAQWSGASLNVRSVCNTDSIRFIIKNIGTGGMTTPVEYIVVEDAVMLMQAPVPLLAAGDSVTISFPANGSTWRVEVGQESHHPYPQPPSLSVEGCTTSSSFTTGYINQFPLNDPPPTVDIDCTSNTGSYDPNDKHGYPIGYGAVHYIRPGTEIEYLIRFQNTGTDTAFTVRIIDTLSTWLDPTTVQFGASSHPYRFDICGEGIVHFIFEDIMLPDSNVNEPASHGFATFTVLPRSNAALESVIENAAAIYFDYNDPVITNTTTHRLGEDFITVGLFQPSLPNIQILTAPNPFSEESILTVKGLEPNELVELQIFDVKGFEIQRMESTNAIFQLKKKDWPTGIYFFKVISNQKIVGTGKLIAQ